MFKPKALAIFVTQVFFLIGITANAQKTSNSKDLQSYVSAAIAKTYPASVLMWEIDATSGSRMSAQFSGVVVSKDGTILSAAHVVMNGKSYKVMFPDGRECTAKGLGRITIPPNFMIPDAAMLKINEAGPWPFAEMGWSSSLVIGQPCISIAYPESVEQRKPDVRFGNITVLKNQYGFVESSCIMEPGDSGGPLFDLLGRVIGIHSGIQIPEDVNYEVPVDTYRKYWSALNKAENYKALPADSDAILKDNLIAELSAIPTKNTLQTKINTANQQVKGTYVKIKSIVDGKEQQIIGTVFSVEGLPIQKKLSAKTILLSKSSMIGVNTVIASQNGTLIKVTVLARSIANDLVMLTPSKDVGKGVKLNVSADSISFADLGTFLTSPMADTAAKAGVLSTTYINLPKVSSYGYIGATTAVQGDKLGIKYVQPNSAAELAGLQAGDMVETISGTAVEDELDFVKAFSKYSAGDTVVIAGSKAGIAYKKIAVLKYPPLKISNHPADHFAGGKSVRRDGFKNVLIQDATIKPQQCGGPLFDLNGKFIGVNIARLSRTSTVVIPAATVKQFVIASLSK